MALPNQTFANSGSSFYGDPADWSKFSTINDVIRFNSTNATLQVFPAVPDTNTSIAFNGNQLAYAQDIPDLANWAQFPANHDVIINTPYSLRADSAYISTLTVYQQTTDNNINVSSFTASTLTVEQQANIKNLITPNISNSTVTITANHPNIIETPALKLISQNGSGGNINILSQAGIIGTGGGLITLQSDGGSGLVGLNGAIDIIANSGSSAVAGVTTGGRIDITANSGINDFSVTSAIKLSAAGINIQSGITSPITSVAGYTFVGGNLGVNSCAGIPSIIPNVPGTNYIYGTNGIVLNSDVYTSDVYPYWNGVTNPADLKLHGRTVNVGLGPYNAMVSLSNVNNISFETSGFRTGGAITGLSSINGTPYPNPSGGGWVSTATSALNMSSYPIQSTTTIGFTKLPPVTVFDQVGIQAALNPTGNGTVFQAYNPLTVTDPPVVMPIRTSQFYLTAGSSTSPPATYATDLMLNAPGDTRIYTAQFNLSPTVSSFTVAYLSDPKNQYDVYVSPNGVDENSAIKASGKLLNPFRTITYALTSIAGVSELNPVTIHLASGLYTENIVITRNNTYIKGDTVKQDINNVTDINGSVTFNVTGGTGGVYGGISFLNIRQFAFIQSQALSGYYTVASCNINQGSAAPCINTSGTQVGVIHTAFFSQCNINQVNASTNATIALGKCVFRNCNFTSAASSTMINVSVLGRLSLQYCSVVSSYVNTAFNPIINIANTSSVTDGEINYCTISYTNTTADAGLNKCCVRFANTVAVTYQITYCNLLCEGARRTNGGAQYQCIQDTGTGVTTLNYGSLQAGATANHISNSANMTATAYIAVT